MAKIRMPAPFRRKDIYYYRVSVPRDVADLARGKTIVVTVAGEPSAQRLGQNLQVSLRTKDPEVAKRRHHEVSVQANKYYDALREGTSEPLSHKTVLGMAGEIRRIWIDAFDENPGDPKRWLHVQLQDALARSGYSGPFHALTVPVSSQVATALEKRWGPMVDAYLSHRSIIVTEEDRIRLIEATSKSVAEMAEINLRKAKGDYSPDPDADKYPVLMSRKPQSRSTTGALTLSQVVGQEFKERESAASEIRPNTKRKYYKVAADFAKFRNGDDLVSTITLAEGNAWRHALLEANELSPKSIRDRLTNLKTILGWAISNNADGLLFPNGNPLENVRLPSVPVTPGDDKTYTLEEAKKILLLARGQTRPDLRWLPWLSAYTGARINELAQLTPNDVFNLEKHWFLRITSAGGKTLKNSHSERRIPVHNDLVEEGFVAWAKRQFPLDQRMFPQRADQNVALFIRNEVKIDRASVKPSHSWRHLVEDRFTGCGVSDDAKHYITGRSGRGSAADYGKSQELLPGLAKEMQKFPSYFRDTG